MAEAQPSGVRPALRSCATGIEPGALPAKPVYLGCPPRRTAGADLLNGGT
ncbi:hypothetical protein ACFU6R_21950 [Streptomyces sp. NPDC057499]